MVKESGGQDRGCSADDAVMAEAEAEAVVVVVVVVDGLGVLYRENGGGADDCSLRDEKENPMWDSVKKTIKQTNLRKHGRSEK